MKHTFSVGDRVIATSATFPATGVVIYVGEHDDAYDYRVEWESNQYRTSYQEGIDGIHLLPAPR